LQVPGGPLYVQNLSNAKIPPHSQTAMYLFFAVTSDP
jgi:hypothetical protein